VRIEREPRSHEEAKEGSSPISRIVHSHEHGGFGWSLLFSCADGGGIVRHPSYANKLEVVKISKPVAVKAPIQLSPKHKGKYALRAHL
jgi:hypothetical protein